MPPEIMVLEIVKTIVPGVVIIALGVPILRMWSRRLNRRDAPPASLAGIEQRLARIESAIDTMAVEVERISEGQRFTTKLLAGRGEKGA
jgi:hypothetical protein